MAEINNNDSGLVARNIINQNYKLNSPIMWVNMRQSRGGNGVTRYNYLQIKIKEGAPFIEGDIIKFFRIKKVGNLTQRGNIKCYSWISDNNNAPYWLSKFPDAYIFPFHFGIWNAIYNFPTSWQKTAGGKYLKGFYRKLRSDNTKWTASIKIGVGVFRNNLKIWEMELGKLNISFSPTNDVENVTFTNRNKDLHID
jgi:hypothetical protein